ncbi:hypothetical protein EAI_06575 [Harpegnathos saltator]|uniref:Uncharacterized protein n=1 Tax=Harpegnathos saltator TaxID=610380 RepID=E2BL05_HARSA|nr:hypothetical protein EAI_06575 [Harpegnathos saltator]
MKRRAEGDKDVRDKGVGEEGAGGSGSKKERYPIRKDGGLRLSPLWQSGVISGPTLKEDASGGARGGVWSGDAELRETTGTSQGGAADGMADHPSLIRDKKGLFVPLVRMIGEGTERTLRLDLDTFRYVNLLAFPENVYIYRIVVRIRHGPERFWSIGV